jgi:TolB-like protein/Flp pilus assembly protein TadD
MCAMAEVGDQERTSLARSGSPDVFISYASPDSIVADGVCAALERNGVRCWIAPRDVMPGEFYGDAIVRAIDATKAIVLVLSQHATASSHVLREVERASSKRHPVISFRIDRAPLPAGLEYFLNTSQWLDASGATPESAMPALVAAVSRVVTGAAPLAPGPTAGGPMATASSAPSGFLDAIHRAAGRPRSRAYLALAVLIAAVVLAAAVALGMHWRGAEQRDRGDVPVAASAASAAPAAFSPPAHSVAVLPFVNMSGDPKQDYFSDGLSEELLNSLSSVRDLRVAARTSSFFFKGKEVDLSDVAHKLNVGAVLEGSVRKDGEHVRITAQLINAVTGYHLWSQTYDRDLKDVLKLQTEIATAVTQAMQATLLADAAATIELGGTKNPQAFDAYLRGKNVGREQFDRNAPLASVAAFDEAIKLDPGFAKAYAGKAQAETGFAEYYGVGPEIREHFERARAAAEKALALAPDLGEAHATFATVLARGFLDFHGALAEYDRSLAVSPNDSTVLLQAGWFYADIGRAEAGAALARRGVSLDQLNPRAYRYLAVVLTVAHQYREAIEAANRSLSLNPKDARQSALRGSTLLRLNEIEAARASCDVPPLDWESRTCLAMVYDKLHRRADAEAQLATMKSEMAEAAAYQYGEIYAQWGDVPRALEWLETAYRLKDPGISGIKTDAFLEPLHNEARFQDMVRKLNFPE